MRLVNIRESEAAPLSPILFKESYNYRDVMFLSYLNSEESA